MRLIKREAFIFLITIILFTVLISCFYIENGLAGDITYDEYTCEITITVGNKDTNPPPSPPPPPNKPSITGPTSGKAGQEYDYTFKATDPDGDQVWYWIEWEDSSVEEWIGPYPSGEEVTIAHTWDELGAYTIRAEAKDPSGAESDWGILKVKMPIHKMSPISLFLGLLERLLNFFNF